MAAARVVRACEFSSERAWSALPLASIDSVTARLHWTDQPYRWHVNDGAEVFAVLDGMVDMQYRADGREYLVTLCAGDVFCAEGGCEHVARPRGEARVLVVERGARA
jgi:mannose-6-phosphate isomerase-like protein (cupin superfamily)